MIREESGYLSILLAQNAQVMREEIMKSRTSRGRNLSIAIMTICLLFAVGCDDDPVVNKDTGVDTNPITADLKIEDNDAGVDAAADASADAIRPPEAPTISNPAENDEVYAAIEVIGSGEPSAQVEATVLLDSNELGKASATADSEGAFTLSVSYGGAQDGDTLTVSVTQTTGGGTSPAATISVTHSAPLTISGEISQTGGATNGTQVFIRLYSSAAPTDLLNYHDEVVATASIGAPMGATPFSFNVGDGTFYLRAFRDSAGPMGRDPDGDPTLGADAQAPVLEVVMAGSSAAGQDLQLIGQTNTEDSYYNFDARTRNDSAAPERPRYEVGDEKLVGQGFCEGYYLRLSAARLGSGPNLSAPMVQLPDGSTVTLLDDGGCGEAVHDNTSSSYDYQADDGDISYGIPDPAATLAGDYTLFFEQTVDGFIHIERDNLSQVIKLPLLREMTDPDGTQVVTDLTPTITWQAVAGAAAYEVNLAQIESGGYQNYDDPGRRVTAPSYTPAAEIIDDACYNVNISAWDAEPDSGDVDAEASGSRHNFCVDTAEDSSITVSGILTNNSGHDVPVGIRVITDSSHNNRATVRVAAGETSYSVGVLAGDNPQSGVITSFVDVAGSGADNSPENQGLRFEIGGLDFQTAATQPITFHPEILLSGPANEATATSLQPTFSWQDYATTAGANGPSGAFSYALFINPSSSGGFPTTLYAVPSTDTSIDLGNLPAVHFDVAALGTCMMDGGTFSLNASSEPVCTGGTFAPSVTSLTPNEIYQWGVVVVECDFADYNPPDAAETFLQCIQDTVMSGSSYVMSVQRTLTAPNL